MELIIVLIVCAAITASIMSQKNRSPIVGFIAGLLLGPLGVLLALASGRGNTTRCAFCRERIDRGATVCPHCQRALLPRGGVRA